MCFACVFVFAFFYCELDSFSCWRLRFTSSACIWNFVVAGLVYRKWKCKRLWLIGAILRWGIFFVLFCCFCSCCPGFCLFKVCYVAMVCLYIGVLAFHVSCFLSLWYTCFVLCLRLSCCSWMWKVCDAYCSSEVILGMKCGVGSSISFVPIGLFWYLWGWGFPLGFFLFFRMALL